MAREQQARRRINAFLTSKALECVRPYPGPRTLVHPHAAARGQAERPHVVPPPPPSPTLCWPAERHALCGGWPALRRAGYLVAQARLG
eukprot:COSAG02_NODE_10525_length_1921_cov_1.108612_3_plen_88_part_00